MTLSQKRERLTRVAYRVADPTCTPPGSGRLTEHPFDLAETMNLGDGNPTTYRLTRVDRMHVGLAIVDMGEHGIRLVATTSMLDVGPSGTTPKCLDEPFPLVYGEGRREENRTPPTCRVHL